jgi:hypothetical protein
MNPDLLGRAPFGGWALIVGGALYLGFWLGPVLEVDLSILPSHIFQLGYYAVMLTSLGAGLWSHARSRPADAGRTWSTAAAATAIVGLVSVVGLFTLGLVAVGVGEIRNRRNRGAGATMVLGSAMWFILWSIGARFDSEGSLPLTKLERVLSTSGLLLISGSLIAMGVGLLGRRVPSKDQIRTSSHS